MTEPLEIARSHLVEKYRRLYHDHRWSFDNSPPTADRAAWTWQTSDLQDSENSESGPAALITDPDLGLCLYLVNYRHQPKVRETIARALSVQQRLAPSPRASIMAVDEIGPWRVAVHWLVEESELPQWIDQIAEIRERTGHFEEVSTDVVVCRDDWPTACVMHGFPRLLFTTREVLAKQRPEEVEQWQSADEPVADQLSSIPDEFRDSLTSQCAKEAITYAFGNRRQNEKPEVKESSSTDLFNLKIKNFRNIDDLSISFRNSHESVTSTVIHGPNGSGKSSIFEALSFAMSGSSIRYRNYLKDNNRRLWGKQDQYVSHYLARRQGEAGQLPVVGLNGSTSTITADKLAEFGENDDSLASNVFSQECSQSLVSMPAAELGAQIAGAFSTLAADATEFVEQALKNAQDEQRTFNYDWGLRGNVTRRETVLENVSLRLLRPHLDKVDGLIAWLNGAVGDGPLAQKMSRRASQLASWRDEGGKLARSGSFENLADFLHRGGTLVSQINSFLDDLAVTVERWPEDIAQSWDLLATWEAARGAGAPAAAAGQADGGKLSSLQLSLRECLTEGNLLRSHRQSLEAIVSLLPDWQEEREAECPTCGTDVSDRGGIAKVVSDRITLVERELDETRRRYKRLSAEIDRTAKDLAASGAAEPPIPAETQVELSIALDMIGEPITGTADLDKGSREKISAFLTHLRRIPRISFDLENPEALAEHIKGEAADVIAEYERVANLPAAWKKVRDTLQARLAQVTAEHLPSTVQALWNELAQNMLPAPWQYPGRLGLKVAGSRAGAEVAMVVRTGSKEALAAHLLNGAEVHNVGLAWFLTRYALQGRFIHRAVVLDDPAHAMDQPTFREFCRLLETLLRIHRIKQIPLSMVLLLHQDGRAIDAARATGGTLQFLRWNHHTPVSVRRIRLHDESAAPPKPIPRLRAIQKVG